MALGLSYFIVGIPIQLTDCLANLLSVSQRSLWEILIAESRGVYVRPMLWGQIKVAYEAAQGHYFTMFKAIQVAQVVVVALLFVKLLRVRTPTDVVVVPLGVAMLYAGHTFRGTVMEAFPINTFLTIVIACLAAAVLVLGSYERWRGPAAVLLLAFSLLTLESGVLVWVCLVAGWWLGGRGVSKAAVVTATVVVGAYLIARFAMPGNSMPGLTERPSGFGFGTLEGQSLVDRFGQSPLVFYVHNVLVQVLSVLFGEPRGGTWTVVRDVLNARWRIGQILAVATTTAATLIVAGYAGARGRQWRGGDLNHDDRLIGLFVAVLVANAAVSFAYVKDVIASPAGAFHALAAAAALRALLPRLCTARALTLVAASAALCLLSAGWTVRLVGTGYALREYAFVVRNEWTELDRWATRNAIDYGATPEMSSLTRTLRDDALARRTPAPRFAESPASKYFY
jgi:hypothetical protein